MAGHNAPNIALFFIQGDWVRVPALGPAIHNEVLWDVTPYGLAKVNRRFVLCDTIFQKIVFIKLLW
jgi:hypothetical protein